MASVNMDMVKKSKRTEIVWGEDQRSSFVLDGIKRQGGNWLYKQGFHRKDNNDIYNTLTIIEIVGVSAKIY